MMINSPIGQSFQTDFSYQGNAKIHFSNSSEIETDCLIKVEKSGKCNIEINLQNTEINQKIQSIQVKTLSEDICINSNIYILPRDYDLTDIIRSQGINLILSTDKFEVETHEHQQLTPKYWIIPLTNLITDFSQREILETDVNRFYPHRLINFKYNNSQCWIEPLPDYDHRKNRLNLEQEHCTITSIMVGEVGSMSIATADVERNFPFDLLYVLGLATGTEVQVPWIEFRDENYKLVKRIHHNIYPLPYIKGHVAIKGNEPDPNSGIGTLLEKSLSSSHFRQSYLRGSLELTIQAGDPKQRLSNRKDLLIRALESLCKKYEVNNQILNSGLNDAQKTQLNTIINDVVTQIKSITESGSERNILNRIAERIRNSTKKDNDFGLAVVYLLNRPEFQLQDATIIDDHYHRNPRTDGRKSFAGILSYYRGAVFHEGYFNFDSKYDFEDVVRYLKHLHDILIRINLKMLNYDGNYQTVVSNKSSKHVNWVTNMTQAEELGYK
ncbi:hypothetical protein H6G80_23340 [Nostoc sp. FACHB-87]|uniref:hypothetical protein n=1 Tax=Nostocaceae TaxID=1162 RepID=UPI0016839AC5|nr:MULTISPECIES: hypothetical protein [Nostocaceae]MBD2456997.1 hypothetical protein [Nostoc sp. FACHB-87]MBD2477091.1 hypothetical protein [Anabaena sp. FACHB-83]